MYTGSRRSTGSISVMTCSAVSAVASCQPFTTIRPPFESTATMHAIPRHRVARLLEECTIRPSFVNADVPTITLCAPCWTKSAGALGGSDAAACADRRTRRQHGNDTVVRTAPHRGIEIDNLDLGKGCELAQHLVRRVALERLIAALNELYDLAVHQVDTGNDHAEAHGDARGFYQGFFQIDRPCTYRNERSEAASAASAHLGKYATKCSGVPAPPLTR